jgi:hypothetical protein
MQPDVAIRILLQRSLLIVVTFLMSKILNVLSHLIFIVTLSACVTGTSPELGAATGPVNTGPKVDIEEIRAVLRCGRDEVAVCIAIDCVAEDYACAKRDDIRHMLNPVIRQ